VELKKIGEGDADTPLDVIIVIDNNNINNNNNK
jgi:hypothetical protein